LKKHNQDINWSLERSPCPGVPEKLVGMNIARKESRRERKRDEKTELIDKQPKKIGKVCMRN